MPSLEACHTCHNQKHCINPFVAFCSDSDDDSSISLTDTSRTGWGLEEWSDDETLQDLEDLWDLELLNEVNYVVRNDRWHHKRLDWDKHVRQLLHEGVYENEYGMSLSSHRDLICILDPILHSKDYNCSSDKPILVEHVGATG